MSRWIKAVVATGFVVVLLGGYFLVRSPNNSNGAPIEFSDARLQGALISQEIVNLSDQASLEIGIIEELGKEGDFDEAVRRTALVLNQSQDIRDKAVELSAELDVMTHALVSIESVVAREAALSAITDWLTMISRLINYSGYVSRLMDLLRNRFIGIHDAEDITTLVRRINDEIQAINGLDTQARDAIKRFDRLIAE